MSEKIEFILPIGAFGASSHDTALDTLMRRIAVKYDADPDGSWAEKYGTNFKNESFEMSTFYWGDCECGHESLMAKFCAENRCSDECYQSHLRAEKKKHGLWYYDYGPDGNITYYEENPKRSYDETKKIEDKIYEKLLKKFGLERCGCAVHCTCGRKEIIEKFCQENPHDPECRIVKPNFRHYSTGFEVEWYKYIGRGMKTNKELTREIWEKITVDLLTDTPPTKVSG